MFKVFSWHSDVCLIPSDCVKVLHKQYNSGRFTIESLFKMNYIGVCHRGLSHHLGQPYPILECWFGDSASEPAPFECHPERQQMMAQVLVSLPLTREIHMESQASGFGLVQLWLLTTFGGVNEQKEYLSLSLPLCCSAFEININK